MPGVLDLIGQRFGNLIVVERAENSTRGRARWLCKCDCGNEKVIDSNCLNSGMTKSCGCLRTKKLIERNYQHGQARTRLYRIYAGMKKRCLNPNTTGYKYYGGRGITICDEWLDNFNSFFEWAINNGYRDGLTIDRVDSDANYEPSNCRWATHAEQMQNRRVCRNITHNGKTQTVAEWSRETGVPYHIIERQAMKLEKLLNMTIEEGADDLCKNR